MDRDRGGEEEGEMKHKHDNKMMSLNFLSGVYFYRQIDCIGQNARECNTNNVKTDLSVRSKMF